MFPFVCHVNYNSLGILVYHCHLDVLIDIKMAVGIPNQTSNFMSCTYRNLSSVAQPIDLGELYVDIKSHPGGKYCKKY